MPGLKAGLFNLAARQKDFASSRPRRLGGKAELFGPTSFMLRLVLVNTLTVFWGVFDGR